MNRANSQALVYLAKLLYSLGYPTQVFSSKSENIQQKYGGLW